MAVDLLEAFRTDPGSCAILLDVDGTLAPIVPHPDLSEVPAESLEVLRRLVRRFALVACISGRAATEVMRLVPVDGIAVSGNHGLEIAEGGVVHTAIEVEPFVPALAELTRRLTPLAAEVGGWVEDKGVTLTVHYRQSPAPAAAEDRLREAALPLVAASGLAGRFGRMVMEVRPPVPIDKGTAVRGLLRGRHIRQSLYAGDDTTDLDAFGAVDVPIAVLSPEAPAGLAEAAPITVPGVEGLRALLATLA